MRLLMEPLLVIFFFVAVVVFLQNRSKERQEKMRILEEALRSGHLDAATKAELVGELTGRRPAGPRGQGEPRGRNITSNAGKLMFGIGWLGLFTGIGLMLMDERDAFEAGVVVSCLGFAGLSLPIALREIDRDRQRSKT